MLERKKSEMRARIRQNLQELPPDRVKEDSRALCRHLLESPLLEGRPPLFAFYPMSGEVDLRYLFESIFPNGGDLYLPRVEDRDLRFQLFREDDPLRINSMGISEPVPGFREVITALPADSLILLPGLAYDRQGGRLGRGGGFYDRWLSSLPPGKDKPTLCGVCFESQLLHKIPLEEWDQSVQWLVTDKEMIRCGADSGQI